MNEKYQPTLKFGVGKVLKIETDQNILVQWLSCEQINGPLQVEPC